MKSELSRPILKKIRVQIKNFFKLHPVKAELFHAHGRTHMTKVIFSFRNFANAPKSLFENETRPKYALDQMLPHLMTYSTWYTQLPLSDEGLLLCPDCL